jgi:hypothetical protein
MLALLHRRNFVFSSNVNSHNVIFDIDGKRVGFAPSSCKYEDYGQKAGSTVPTAQPTTPEERSAGKSCDSKTGELVPLDLCTARCKEVNVSTAYIVEGQQRWADRCFPSTVVETRACHVACSKDNVVISAPVSILCPEAPWTECYKSCKQYRTIQRANGPNEKCAAGVTVDSRPCYSGVCPVNTGQFAARHEVVSSNKLIFRRLLDLH